MTDNVIKLNKDNILRLKIETSDGKDTGEFLEFDLADIEMPLRYQEMIEKDKKNKENLKNQLILIEKRQDVKGKKLLSKNEEDKLRAINDFFNKEADIYNMFLGNNGFQKLLNGRKMNWMIFDEVDEIIEKQILPKVQVNMDDITNKIKEKYTQATKQSSEIEVLD